MPDSDLIEDEEPCLCQSFVPEDKRIDFMAVRPDAKTGKPKMKVYLRYHQDCPDHGLALHEGEPKTHSANNPNRPQRIVR